MASEEYKESDLSKIVKRLMDEEGFEFGEAVKEAMEQTKNFESKANGGSIGIEVLFGPKRQNLFMGGPALTGPALNIYNSMKAYQSFTDQEIADAIKEAGYSLSTADSGTTTPPDSTPGSSQPSGDGDGNRNIGSGGFGLQTPAQNVAEFQAYKDKINAEAMNSPLPQELLSLDQKKGNPAFMGTVPNPGDYAYSGPVQQFSQIGENLYDVDPLGTITGQRTYKEPRTIADQVYAAAAKDQLGTGVNEESVVDVEAVQAAIDRAKAQNQAPSAPVGITDRNRGMAEPGAPTGAYEMIGGTPVAIGDVLGKQMALEKADFSEETPQGINYNNLGILGTLGGLLTGSTPLKMLGMFGNYKSGKTGRVFDSFSKGIASLAGRMRGINPITGKPNTQAQYEANREAARTQNRIDNMLDRKAKGKNYSEKNLKDLIGEQIGDRKDKSGSGKKSGFTNPGTNSYGPHKGSGGNGSGGGKIVCTMMNERYGFGSFRNKIWMKFHEHHGPEYQKGYHAIFLPLVKIAKGEGKINTAVRKVLEHMGRNVTADIFKIMKGKKRDTLGRIYRAIFEPTCHIIGKIKSALGRG